MSAKSFSKDSSTGVPFTGSFKSASMSANSFSKDSSTGVSKSNSVEVSLTPKISAAISVGEFESSSKLKSAKLKVEFEFKLISGSDNIVSSSMNVTNSVISLFIINSSEILSEECVISSANKIKLSSLLSSILSESSKFAVVSGS